MQILVQGVIKREKENQHSVFVDYEKTWKNAQFPRIELVIDLWNAEFERATKIMMETNASCNRRMTNIYNFAEQGANRTPKEADDIWKKAFDEVDDAKKSKEFNWHNLFMEAVNKMEEIINEKRTKMTDIDRSETSIRRAMMDDEKRIIQTLTSRMWKEKREIEEKQKRTTQCVAANNMTSMRSNNGAWYGGRDSSATSHRYVYHHMTNGTVAALQVKY